MKMAEGTIKVITCVANVG